MRIWPLLLVAVFAGFIGLWELDWSQLFPDPAREALQDLWTEIQGWNDVDARLWIWGAGSEPVRLRVQAIMGEGALRVEFLEPPELREHVFTYRKGLLVHFRPGNGGLRIVYQLDEEGRLPEVSVRPQDLRPHLEEAEPPGAGWKPPVSPPLDLPGLAGTSPPSPGFSSTPVSPSWPWGYKRLRITGFPEPLGEVVLWLDERGLRGGSVDFGETKVTVLIEELRANQGLTLIQLLRLPPAAKTLWYEEGQSR
mgnify:CR=1 FL=1